MVIHDMECSECGFPAADMPLYVENTPCVSCKHGHMVIRWQRATRRDARAIGGREATVVYEHPDTGHVVYPGRADQPMPPRYQLRGYTRKELTTLREVDRFSREHKVVHEASHYDRGSGRGYDD